MALDKAFRSATAAVTGTLVVIVLALALVAILVNRAPQPDDGATPVGAAPIASSAPLETPDTPAAITEAMDVFTAECAYEAHRATRILSDRELQKLDSDAKARGGKGHWLVDGDPWAPGQLWIGDRADAITAFGGTSVEAAAAQRPGEWIVTEMDGRPIAMTLRSIHLPSGLMLWAPQDTIVPVDCQQT